MKLRTYIVDDEPLAREWIRKQLEEDPDIDVVGESGDGFKAAVAIEELKPDLLFLDVQMPGLDGFGLLETLGPHAPANVVFITAFDQYAVRAFDVHALDYILKPFGRERVQEALARTKKRLLQQTTAQLTEKLLAVASSLGDERRYPEWFLVKAEGKSFFLKVVEIDWIEAARNNVILHVGTAAHVYHETTQGIEARLDPKRFLRIHRSTIVNIERIKELEPWFNGEYSVTLKDGTKLTMSASYKDRLRDFRKPAM